MKKFLASFLLMAICTVAVAEENPDFSRLAASSHPRLWLGKSEFQQLKKDVRRGKTFCLENMHNLEMEYYQRIIADDTPLEYKRDASGRRILRVSRRALSEIFCCAYVYRMTGDKKAVKKAESLMLAASDFPDWNGKKHFLDGAEMSLAMAVGYDWLYDVLSKDTKKKVEDAVLKYSLGITAGHNYGWKKNPMNWNSVCNAGILCAAIAFYECYPEVAGQVISEAIPSMRKGMEGIYGDSGAYPEGPGYWSYGTSFQIMSNFALQQVFGSDFGLSDMEGFKKSADYELFMEGNAGKTFNYSDNKDKIMPREEYWYYAWRYNRPEVLCSTISRFEDKEKPVEPSRYFPLSIYFASKYDGKKVAGPSSRLYVSQGEIPLVVARTGWGKEDLYLGIKGGKADHAHAHMDAGSFVYDAYGLRWAMDFGAQEYRRMEIALKKLNPDKEDGRFFDRKQDSPRWMVFTYNNRAHNTLTINDKDHDVNGFVTLREVVDEKDRIGGSFDMTPLFFGAVTSAVRTALIRDNSYLEIRDEITACGSEDAGVRWTMATYGMPEIVEDGIILSRKAGARVKLHAEGAGVEYHIWSSDPKDYPTPISEAQTKRKGTFLVGFTYTVPRGSSSDIVVTLKKL